MKLLIDARWPKGDARCGKLPHRRQRMLVYVLVFNDRRDREIDVVIVKSNGTGFLFHSHRLKGVFLDRRIHIWPDVLWLYARKLDRSTCLLVIYKDLPDTERRGKSLQNQPKH